MAETLTSSSEGSEVESMDMETIRSRFNLLSEMLAGALYSSSDVASFDPMKLLADCVSSFQRSMEQIDLEDPNIAAQRPEDLGAYIEQLKKELNSTQEENVKLSSEINTLTKSISADTAQFGADLESLACSLSLIDSQGQQFDAHDAQADRVIPVTIDEGPMDLPEDQKFKILELSGKLEKSISNLSTLEYLDSAFKRVEAIGQIEELLSEVRVIEFKGNHIRLLLKTPIPSVDSLPLQYNSASFIEPTVVDHELMIEVLENNLEPMKLEIFPADVYVDEIIRNAKSSRHISTMMTGSFLGWLVRQVQKRILLCTIRRYFVRDANKSRYSFEYSDRDETITAHMVGGINAFLKASQDWPLSSAPLTLISMKNSDTHSGSISLSFLCKVKMAPMNNQQPAEYTGATIQSFNGNRLTYNRPIMNPMELFYGDSYLKLTGRSSLQAASPDQVLFNFHLREYCEWLRPPDMSSPVCITNTSVLHWSSSDHLHNFTNTEASRRSVHNMLIDIPFRAESKELWKLAIALFARLMVNRITDERCRVVEIDVKVVALTRRLIAPNVRRTMVERHLPPSGLSLSSDHLFEKTACMASPLIILRLLLLHQLLNARGEEKSHFGPVLVSLQGFVRVSWKMKLFHCGSLLTDSFNNRPCFCNFVTLAIFLSMAFLVGSPLLVSDYKQRLLGWGTTASVQNAKASLCKFQSQCNPSGSEPLPAGIVSRTSNLEMQPLWDSAQSSKKKGSKKAAKSLLAIAVGIKQKEGVDQLVKKFSSSDFTVMLFHYDGVVDQWRDLQWSDNAVHISAINQTKWWFAKRFLHPDIVAEYNYIFLWDEDLGVEHFHPGRYLSIVKKEGLEISQPGLDTANSEVHHQITARRRKGDVHRRMYKFNGGGRCYENSTAPPCTGWVEMMAPVFSRAAWRCAWHMIQNDLIHAWGLDYKLGYCAQGDRTRNVGVVDSEYIVHKGIPTLGGSYTNKTNEEKPDTSTQSEASNSKTRLRSRSSASENRSAVRSKSTTNEDRSAVRIRSYAELIIFKKRWQKAVAEDSCWTDPYPEPADKNRS
ncbi:hypothetical protein J5N97_007234 [Dioscorea zingiberensis]|uniref:Uncharacterized protein n=2 Tax=Magnoliopsida TaxID=3398 RepID=A0A9D5HUA6_9LILI|nr:hypothetical protein J5N97_007234 [Dioscorea zingiberensis]